MWNNKEKCLYKYDVRCPNCKRKLMILNLPTCNVPQISILERNDLGYHYAETRCHICKTFVAVD